MQYETKYHLPQFFGFVLCFPLLSLWATEGYTQIPEDLKDLFQTMDDLSPPGIWNKPLVRLEFANSARWKSNSEFGILIEQSEQSVSIWNSRLQLLQFPIHNAKETDRVAEMVEIVTLPDQIRFFKETLNPDKALFNSHAISAVFWARVSHACNEPKIRDELVEKAKLLLRDRPLSYLTEDIIPYEEYLRIVRSFEYTSTSRERILDELMRFVRLFPDFGKIAQAIQLRDDVKSLVDEDAKRANIIDVDALPVDESIAELIYQLRNQEDLPLMSMQYHRARLDASANPHENESCWKLYRLGFAAVPQLIEAISDSRPSRIVEYPRIFSNRVDILTIGNCAELILCRFVDNKPAFQSASIVERQVAYRDWYAEVKRVGVKAHLISIVEKGESSAEEPAILLARFYPDDALKAIQIGIGRTTQPGTRNILVEVMSTLGEK